MSSFFTSPEMDVDYYFDEPEHGDRKIIIWHGNEEWIVIEKKKNGYITASGRGLLDKENAEFFRNWILESQKFYLHNYEKNT